MKAYLINLDRSPERLADADAELKSAGVSYERVKATDARLLTEGDIIRNCSRLRFFLAQARRVKIGEIACALSHQSCWRRLVESGEVRAAVFEDDVAVDGTRFAEVTAMIAAEDDGVPRVWLLNHRNLVEDPGIRASVRLVDTPHNVHTCWGTESYVLNRSAAELLLRLCHPVRYIADAWSTYARRGVDVRVVFPTPCGLREVASEIERKATGRAGWKWYLAFGRFKFRVAFHIDNLFYRIGELVKG